MSPPDLVVHWTVEAVSAELAAEELWGRGATAAVHASLAPGRAGRRGPRRTDPGGRASPRSVAACVQCLRWV